MGGAGRALAVGVAALVALFALTFANGARGLAEPSEARYGSVAAEMERSGDWLVPRLNGVEHLEKPPLATWAMAASMEAFGESEAALRLPGSLAALVALSAAFALAGGARVRRASWTAGFVLASPLFLAMARVVTTDVYLAACCALALLGASRAVDPARDARARGRGLTLAAVASALGFMVKGPVVWIQVLLPLVVACAWARDRATLRGIFAWKRVALFLALALPWFLLVSWRIPGAFAWFVERRVTGPMTSSSGFHEGPPWYYVPVFLLGFLPAGTVLLAAPRELWKLVHEDAVARLMLCALAVPFVVLSFSASKLVTYLLPLAIPCAVLAAQLVERGVARRGLVAGAVLWLLVALAGAIAGRARFAELPSAAVAFFSAAGLVAGLGALAAGAFFLRGRVERGARVLLVAQVGALLLCLPRAGTAEESVVRSGSGRAIGLATRKLAADGRPIVCYRCFVSALPFYTGRDVLVADLYDETDAGYTRALDAVRITGDDALRTLVARGPIALLCHANQRARLEAAVGPLALVAESGKLQLLANASAPLLRRP